MKTFISCLLISLLSFGLLVNEASAKRFGGGRSFGVQRAKNAYSHSAPKNNFKQKASSQSRKWGGFLGGLLAGGLLASLFMGNGLAAGLMSWLIIGSILLMGLMLLRKKLSPAFHNASFSPAQGAVHSTNYDSYSGDSLASMSQDFASNTFLRDAKVMFYRLQSAYDQKNLHDLQLFTAPEVYAEIKTQLDERGDLSNHTEVSGLQAELLGIESQTEGLMASVRFSGTIVENDKTSAFDEIWHFRKFAGQQEWVVGGIQQS